MKKIHWHSAALILTAAGLQIGSTGSALAAKKGTPGSTFPTVHTVTDSGASTRIRGYMGIDTTYSDAALADGDACVRSVGGSQGGGPALLWTVDIRDESCLANTRGDDWRTLTFDFSEYVPIGPCPGVIVGSSCVPGDLDGYDGPQVIENAPAWWIVHSPWKDPPTAESTTIWVFGIDNNGTPSDRTDDTLTGDEKAWRLRFIDFDAVVSESDGTRTITPNTTLVEVHEKVLMSSGKKRQFFEWEYRGTYRMYFTLSISAPAP